MNVWFDDPRVKRAEADAFEAERAERRGELTRARELYQKAAQAFGTVALCVPPDHPNTRTDLAIAAVASYSRAGNFGQALDLGQRVLAEGDALTERGKRELLHLLREYSEVATAVQPPQRHTTNRGAAVRQGVRAHFDRSAA